jgi:hypothetical protein
VCTSPADFTRTGPYDAARAASTAGFVIGGLAIAAGIPLLVLSPKVEYVDANGHVVGPPKDAPSARIEPWIGAGSVGVRGQF